jgi:3-hydroxyisobutyrate dehydrogenase-like beta-hydroxyacid dehydrogenase
MLAAMNVAFIGLGKMGSGMARNLLRAGHRVTVYNRTTRKSEALEKDGASVGDSPAAACRGAEAAITMLSDDHTVEEMVFGDSGLAAGLESNAVHISSSTISTALALRMTNEHRQRGQAFLSAPVFGRPEAAEAKKLLVVSAGDPRTIDRCRPVFDAIGRATFVAGTEPWQANAVKLSGNFMIASMIETFGEAFALMRKSNVDPHFFLEVMNSLFGSPVYANYGSTIANESFEPAGFGLKLGLKDTRLMLQAAEEQAVPLPIASLLRDQFLSAIAHGQGETDWSSVSKVAARNAGL